jgi:hypothetical protein
LHIHKHSEHALSHQNLIHIVMDTEQDQASEISFPPAKRARITQFRPTVFVVAKHHLRITGDVDINDTIQKDRREFTGSYFDQVKANQIALQYSAELWKNEEPHFLEHTDDVDDEEVYGYSLLDEYDCPAIATAPYRSKTNIEKYEPASELMKFSRPSALFQIMLNAPILIEVPPELFSIVIEYVGLDAHLYAEMLNYTACYLQNCALPDGSIAADPPGINGDEWNFTWYTVGSVSIYDAFIDETLIGTGRPSASLDIDDSDPNPVKEMSM